MPIDRNQVLASEMLEEATCGELSEFLSPSSSTGQPPDWLASRIRTHIIGWCRIVAHTETVSIGGVDTPPERIASLIEAGRDDVTRALATLALQAKMEEVQAATLKLQLRRYQDKYRIRDDDMEQIFDAAQAITKKEQTLKIVKAGQYRFPERDEVEVRESFHTYCSQEADNIYVVTIPNFPELYANGKDPAEAVDRLMDVMLGFKTDLNKVSQTLIGAEARALKDFLNRTLGTVTNDGLK